MSTTEPRYCVVVTENPYDTWIVIDTFRGDRRVGPPHDHPDEAWAVADALNEAAAA